MARRSRKSEEVRDALSGVEDSASTPPDDSASQSPARRAADRDRHVSVKEAAGLLDRDRNTISKWLDQGCPFVQKADRDLGRAWVLDLAEVVRWLEKRAADTTAEKLGAGADGLISKDEAERRTAIAKMTVAEKVAAEAVGTVVPVSVVIDRVSEDYNKIRSRLMALPTAIAGRVDQRLSDKAREVADEIVRDALESFRADKTVDPNAGE
jgi:phage terminase Nu1 subunit (DNA packaging protein)